MSPELAAFRLVALVFAYQVSMLEAFMCGTIVNVSGNVPHVVKNVGVQVSAYLLGSIVNHSKYLGYGLSPSSLCQIFLNSELVSQHVNLAPTINA